jgi:hypothetical protein
MTVAEELALKQAEFNELSRKILNLPAGEVRVELKRKRNGLTGQMVLLHQKLIAEQVASDNPQHVPPLNFGTERIRNPQPEDETSNQGDL